MQRVDEIHVYRGFSSILSNHCCFLSFQEKRLSFVCWCVGYGGNNVGALSKSTRVEEREREKEKRERRRERGERERAHSRDNGRGRVVGMRTRMGIGRR